MSRGVVAPRTRTSFSRLKHVLDLPNLIDIQKASFRWFLEEGLRETIDDISPIEDYTGTLAVEFGDQDIDSFTMNVRKANRHGRALRGEQTVSVDVKTKMRRRGKEGQASLTDLVKDDRLHVLARCKPGETAGSFTLLARLVLARPAPAAAAAPASA